MKVTCGESTVPSIVTWLRQRRSILGKLLVVCAVVAIAVLGLLSYRKQAMDRLYAEAAGHPQFYRGSQESQDAVKKLATYRGQRTTDLLLALALQNNPLAPEAQTEAIRALREREDPRIAAALANLLQPHEGLNARQAVAVALKDLPCKGECILSIFHYLERIWRGDSNHEDRWVDSAEMTNGTASLKKDQQSLYSALHAVLRRERMETLGGLIKVHGVGSSDPSPFALDLLPRLQLHEACPYLLQSDRQIKNLSPEFYNAPRQELQAAITSLKCK